MSEPEQIVSRILEGVEGTSLPVLVTPWDADRLLEHGVVSHAARILVGPPAPYEVGAVVARNGNRAAYGQIYLTPPLRESYLQERALQLLSFGEEFGGTPLTLSAERRLVLNRVAVTTSDDETESLARGLAHSLAATRAQVPRFAEKLRRMFQVGPPEAGDAVILFKTGQIDGLPQEVAPWAYNGHFVSMLDLAGEWAQQTNPVSLIEFLKDVARGSG